MTTSPRRLRTWSAFGDIRRMPSEYEITTHQTNWTLRDGRKAALEQNPSSPMNLWMKTYRDLSAVQCSNWDAFRDPDTLTYRKYVAVQDDAGRALDGILDEYAESAHDLELSAYWLNTLHRLFSVTRFPLHGAQQVLAYTGYMAPSSYITNCATFAAADILRRTSVVAYRTTELGSAHPELGFGPTERAVWQSDPAWQPARELIETALVAYDWAEAFVAMNLVILPTLDDLLLTQLRSAAREVGDDLTWLMLGNLVDDAERRARWSVALAAFAIEDTPRNADVVAKWIARWSPRADAAVAALAGELSSVPGFEAREVVASAASARASLLTLVDLGSSARAS